MRRVEKRIVALRHEGKSWREIGAIVGLSHEACRKNFPAFEVRVEEAELVATIARICAEIDAEEGPGIDELLRGISASTKNADVKRWFDATLALNVGGKRASWRFRA